MDQTLRIIVLLVAGGGAMTALAGAALHWWEPARRLARTLRSVLSGRPDAALVAPERGQAVGILIDARRLAVLRGPQDGGLLFDLDELMGAELIFDGLVAARAMRGQPLRPLENISPQLGRLILRLVFDDVREPEFDLELWRADDPPRINWDREAAVQAARRFFAQVEALVRR